eukprot:6191275-Pleurochrysis_carterae.AAC.1
MSRRDGPQRGVAVEESKEVFPDEELLERGPAFPVPTPASDRRWSARRRRLSGVAQRRWRGCHCVAARSAGAKARSREASTEPSEAPRPRKRCSARSWHLVIAEREALAAVSCCGPPMLQVMQEGEEGRKVI